MAEINENIKPWRREISEEEWAAIWANAIVTVSKPKPITVESEFECCGCDGCGFDCGCPCS